ncbi:MAG: hypothetical protein ACON4H_16705 [Rubripirellula sp.]
MLTRNLVDMGFFHAPEETAGDLSLYLEMTYAFSATCGRLSFCPLRNTFRHTFGRSLALIPAKVSAFSG